MAKVDLIVQGRVVLGDEIISDGAVAVHSGMIAAVGKRDSMPDSVDTIDGGHCLVMPGFIDAHVHSFGTTNEGIINSTRAAAAGGVTTIIDHPLDLPHAPVTVEEMREKKERCQKESLVDFGLLGAVTANSIEDIDGTSKLGLVGYKLLMSDTAPNRMKRVNDGELLEAFGELARVGKIGGLHAENDDILKHFEEKLKAEGKVYPRAHAEAHPPVSETEAVASAIQFAKSVKAHVHFFHLSLPESVEIVKREKAFYPHISCETCPHYLVMNVDQMNDMGGRAKINPPLRTKKDCEGLWEQLGREELDLITSDHAPHPVSTKGNKENIFMNSSGAPGVETIVPIVYSEGVGKGRITLPQMLKYLCLNPAKLFGLYPRKGVLAPGADADLVIFDPDEMWTLQEKSLHYVAGWTPYEGMKVKGKTIKTILRGKTIYDKGKIIGEPGCGEFIPSDE